MPLPQAGHFTRADETALHARLSEQFGVPHRIREAITEHLARLLGRGGKLRCLRHGGPSFRTRQRTQRRHQNHQNYQADKLRPRLRNRRGRET
ncbi:amidohydrolase [Streptomyces azureus]|uniref:Amidohydrolase n=1 Tax=Streptomyces azureus TaxID=146537 RepID=A0A0K8PDH5_STRAJ|nr:amidohydrolase [Streptomyces azureus]